VLEREGVAVHGIGKYGLASAGRVEGKAALEIDLAQTSVHHAVVGPAEYYFSSFRQDAGAVEDLDERDAGPFCGADRS
jgi:hypothetical protein